MIVVWKTPYHKEELPFWSKLVGAQRNGGRPDFIIYDDIPQDDTPEFRAKLQAYMEHTEGACRQ
jgi:hypothetical protein